MAEKKPKPANYVGGRPKDESKLSTDPKQVRIRLRRAHRNPKRDGRIARDMEMLYQKPIEEWDFEELAHGRPRAADGSFRGKPPSWVTPYVHKEAKRRLLDETIGQMAGHIGKAVKLIGELIESQEIDDNGKPIVDAKTKLAAATFVIEHFLGKPKLLLEVDATDQTKQALASAIVLDDGADQSHLVLEDAEYWENMERDEENPNAAE